MFDYALHCISMITPLPFGNFDPYSVDISNISDDGENGYIFEASIQYPMHLHVVGKDFRNPKSQIICRKFKQSLNLGLK